MTSADETIINARRLIEEKRGAMEMPMIETTPTKPQKKQKRGKKREKPSKEGTSTKRNGKTKQARSAAITRSSRPVVPPKPKTKEGDLSLIEKVIQIMNTQELIAEDELSEISRRIVVFCGLLYPNEVSNAQILAGVMTVEERARHKDPVRVIMNAVRGPIARGLIKRSSRGNKLFVVPKEGWESSFSPRDRAIIELVTSYRQRLLFSS